MARFFGAVSRFAIFMLVSWIVVTAFTIIASMAGHTEMRRTLPLYEGPVCAAPPKIAVTRVFNLTGGQGTGFGVDGFVVSNAHVVGIVPLVVMIDENGRLDLGWVRAKADFDTRSGYADLAVIEPLFGSLSVTDLPLADASRTEAVYSRGFPKGSLNSTFGVQVPMSTRNALDTDRVVTSGASGSPVVNCNGELTGVIATQAPSAPRLPGTHLRMDNGVVQVEQVAALLRTVK